MSASLALNERLWVHEELSGRCTGRIRESTLVIDAIGRTSEMGGEVHYMATEERLDDLRTQLVLSGRALRMETHELRPLAQIARSAWSAISELVRGEENLPILGVLCLPHALTESIMHRGRDRTFLLVMDGVNGADRDVQLALAGISAFCKHQGVTLAIFP